MTPRLFQSCSGPRSAASWAVVSHTPGAAVAWATHARGPSMVWAPGQGPPRLFLVLARAVGSPRCWPIAELRLSPTPGSPLAERGGDRRGPVRAPFLVVRGHATLLATRRSLPRRWPGCEGPARAARGAGRSSSELATCLCHYSLAGGGAVGARELASPGVGFSARSWSPRPSSEVWLGDKNQVRGPPRHRHTCTPPLMGGSLLVCVQTCSPGLSLSRKGKGPGPSCPECRRRRPSRWSPRCPGRH